MNRISSIALLTFSLSALSPTYSTQEPTTPKKVICVDFDDVLMKAFNVNIRTIIKLIPCIIRHPLTIAYALKDFQAIMQKGYEFAHKNITVKQTIIDVLHYLKDNNYGDLLDYQETLIDIGINPGPIHETIELIKQLKAQGHILIGATNQDYAVNSIYRKKLRNQGINLDELFESILTCYAPAHEIDETLSTSENIYMAEKDIKKPDIRYFEKLKELAQRSGQTISDFYLIDDTDNNIIGAEKAGFHGIQFELPQNSKTGKRIKARQANNKDLHHAAELLKDKLVQEKLL